MPRSAASLLPENGSPRRTVQRPNPLIISGAVRRSSPLCVGRDALSARPEVRNFDSIKSAIPLSSAARLSARLQFKPRMSSPLFSHHHPRVRRVNSFHELATSPFIGGVNALCWERAIVGDFAEVAMRLEATNARNHDGIISLDEERLLTLEVSYSARAAIEFMLTDFRALRAHGYAPELNCIHAYPRDEDPEVVATDVYSFHADSAPVETSTWLCTYHGAPSEGLRNEEALRRVDDPATRAELLKHFGGVDDASFHEYLSENSYDLHYSAHPAAVPFSFGVGNLWRIAVEYPRSPVPACIHRAPSTRPGESARLLLIS